MIRWEIIESRAVQSQSSQNKAKWDIRWIPEIVRIAQKGSSYPKPIQDLAFAQQSTRLRIFFRAHIPYL